MNQRANSHDYLTLMLKDTPLLDVRAPVEFNRGAFPTSLSIPLLDDEQRRLIGTCYKEQGQDSAIELGYSLATPNIKQHRIEAWQKFVHDHPKGYLYCFRGGLRSKVTQQWLHEAGINYPFIEGGYKAIRGYLIEQLEVSIEKMPLVLIGGRTASGKTQIINNVNRSIDLEGLAKHRGSSFGALVDTQPSQINFENSLSVKLLKQRHNNDSPVFMEDEGRLIGQISLVPSLCNAMKFRYPIAIVHTPINQRIHIATKDYVTDLYPSFIATYGEAAHQKFKDSLLFNLSRIQKRLGGELFKVIHNQLDSALDALVQGDSSGFFDPIKTLLTQYYDPMYDYQLSKRQGAIIFEGDIDEVIQWANNYQHINHQQ